MADVIYGEGVQLVLVQNIKILAQFTAFKTLIALYALIVDFFHFLVVHPDSSLLVEVQTDVMQTAGVN